MADILILDGKSKKGCFSQLIQFRELFLFLCWRDILVRYKQTILGVFWAVLRPIVIMVVFTLVFGYFAKMPSEADAPYSILVFAGLLPWQLFSTAVLQSSDSLVTNSSLISKIYFPRLILPASAVMSAVVDALLSLVVLFFLMLYYGIGPSWRIVFLPVFIVVCVVFSFGVGLFFSALSVSYRDFRIVLPFLIQFGLYVSPVGFSSSIVPDGLRFVYYLNPMVGVIDGFRWCIFGQDVNFYIPGFLVSLALIFILLVVGLKTFFKMESTFADKI